MFPTKKGKQKSAFNFEEGIWSMTANPGSEPDSDAMWTLDLKCHRCCETRSQCKDLRTDPDLTPPVHPTAPIKERKRKGKEPVAAARIPADVHPQ